MDEVTPPAQVAALQHKIRGEGRILGATIAWVAETGSTNDQAREQALAGAREGRLVVADVQRQGRGRRGQHWVAPAGGAILASLLLRPRRSLAEAFAPTMILALAVQAAAREVGAPAVLKWPNDVLCRDRKLAGILCEGQVTGDRAAFVVAGFGVNVDFDPAAEGLAAIATSLRQEVAGPPPERWALLDRILAEAETRYQTWQAGGYPAVWEEWRAALVTLGHPVRVDVGPGVLIEGQATRVQRDGALIVATATGEVPVLAGTVRL